MASDPAFSDTTQPGRGRPEPECPYCGYVGVPVRSGRVGLHAPVRMGPRGVHVASGERCAGLGEMPEYPRKGSPSEVA